MTTTSTFQGMNTDGKPSSRVSNPPGGASSNIFGYDDNAAPQRTPIKNNPDNINRGNNDIFNQNQPPQQTGPKNSRGYASRGASDIFNQGSIATDAAASKNRAPRSGEESFHILSGDKQNVDFRRQECSSKSFVGSYRRRNFKSPDTFSNIFGESGCLSRRKAFKKYSDRNLDSYSRLFGDIDVQHVTSRSEQSQPLFDTQSEGGSSFTSICSTPVENHSSSTNSLSSVKINKDIDEMSSSFHRVFGEYFAEQKVHRRRFCDTSAYNPITGEAYEPKQEQSTQRNNCQPKPEEFTPAVEAPPVSENRSGDNSIESKEPKAEQGGMFGNGPAAQEHRSTRVSQPPGGRSTKLW